MTTLAEGQAVAVYLGHAETAFGPMISQSSLRGRIVASGIYLSEAGGVGSV